ncbi:cytochrome c nitrite reductase small subunit [Solitalea longa]|uniref:Cytochrome c nitrite reductase small subunit n=1 Tax=Solitalea longa TaxID=2079460 RepID=A0A2S4ZWY7_9SPHI|nr:cytochrome c nitrite reductase small subunit [Solitalea longa]POY34884.1 cytochrome c nitrite reductase small subunit [Solitalea longa]
MGGKLHKLERFLFRYNLIPPKKWRPAAIVAVATFIGLGLYVLRLSNAASYLSDDPQACVNCHLMTPQYITWSHSSHREVASCNDCHVPHNNVFSKYYFKAKDGLYHASIFTLRAEPQVIKAKSASIEVIQENCVRCHVNQVTDAKMAGFVEDHHAKRTDRTCWECHREVPHGRVKSLSSVGLQLEPIREYASPDMKIIPDWLQKTMEENKQKSTQTK